MLRLETMNYEDDHDACPYCGARVESAISAPGEPLREATERRCPNCGKALHREVGGEWITDSTEATALAASDDEDGAAS